MPASPKTLSFDGSNLDDLPSELRDSLAAFWSEQERKAAEEARQRDLDYQTEQADALVKWEQWQEVDVNVDEEDLLRELIVEKELFESGLVPFGPEHPSIEQEILELEAIDQRPTVHQFYRDLYGLSLVAGSRHLLAPSEDVGLDDFWADRVGLSLEDAPVAVLVNHRDREHPYQLYADYRGFMDAIKEETSFIYLGGFWQPPSGFLTARRNAMTSISGFCVDIDRSEGKDGSFFQASWVIDSLMEVFEEHPELEPNYLMLSGTGIQLWYVFGEQIPLLSARRSPRRQKYNDLLRRLYVRFDEILPPNRFKVDVPCASISHAFRAPGSPSKGHYPTRLFANGGRLRRMVSPLDLSEALGGELKPYDLEDWDQEKYERIRAAAKSDEWKARPASRKQVAYLSKLEAWGCVEAVPEGLSQGEADELIKRGELVATSRIQTKGLIETDAGRKVPRRKRDAGLYEYTLERMHGETPAGSRYNAMFGLAGLAWNCGVPKSKLERDLYLLLDTDWARKLGHDGLPLSRQDVRDAIQGWHRLGALRTRDQLEMRLGWDFAPPAKRNGRKQTVHLAALARPMIDTYRRLGEVEHLPGRPSKGVLVRDYAAEHPGASHSEIARALGISRPTVIKWLKETDNEP